jgi:hypothetical protein
MSIVVFYFRNVIRTYNDAGFGTGVLCSVHSTSSCKSVLDAFRSIDPSLSLSKFNLDRSIRILGHAI